MSERNTKADPAARAAVDRRGFLKAASLGGVAAAASVAPGAITPAEAYDPGEAETRARYRETEHVKAFYRTNSY
jgi:hypothetical protein